MRRIFLYIFISCLIFGCTKNDLLLNLDTLENESLYSIETLKTNFHSDSIAFYRSGNQPKLNYRQSLRRVLYWDYAIKQAQRTYIPIRQYLPKGSITTTGENFLPHRTWLVIERDSLTKNNNYRILTLIAKTSIVDYKNFDGVSILEEYFSGKSIDAIKFGPDLNPLPKATTTKPGYAAGWGSSCAPTSTSGSMRCGPGLNCEYIKVATVCAGTTNNYCADRYEWSCVRRLAPLDPDNPEPLGPPYTGPYPQYPLTPGPLTDFNAESPGINYYVESSDEGINLEDKLACFNKIPNGANTTYKIKICADLANDDNPKALAGPDRVGHSFITLTKTNGNISVIENFGFYPQIGAKSIFGTGVASQIVDDGAKNHEYNASITTSVTQQQFQQILDKAVLKSKSKYDLKDYNCTDYAVEVYNAGMSQTNKIIVDDWIINGGYYGVGVIPIYDYGTTPAGLYKTINSLKNLGKTGANIISGAASHSTNCN